MAISVAYVFCSLLSIFINFETCFVDYNNNSKQVNNNERKALFVFGDSLFDPGNDVYVKTSLKLTSICWPCLSFHHVYNQDLVFTDGANFASGGPIDLPIQVRYFKRLVELLKDKVGEDEAKRIVSNAVYLFSSGDNDYIKFYTKHPDANEQSMRAFVKLVTGQLHNYLLEIKRLGAKKITFQNVGPMGCIPSSRLSDGQCNEKENFLAREHNNALIQVMKKLEGEVPGFKYSIMDYYTALKNRIFNPHKYGFKEGEIACCGGAFRAKFVCGGYRKYPFKLCKNPFEYVWFDGEHTSEGANLRLSRLIWEGGPPNIIYKFHY